MKVNALKKSKYEGEEKRGGKKGGTLSAR